ncbi:MAG: DNA polymerase III subunit delta [Prevotellaceae bacterium]|jgi:DNA polymerase-3 subunit delta'|nr:DNA polymerase III subunit delta [Prevotellaceae bacterium]
MFFRDIVGQGKLKEKLVSTVVEERVSHAQLFEGAAGYGSLPLAFAYAQFIACTNRKGDDSCGVCPSCIKYNKMVHPDQHFVFPVNSSKKYKDSEKHPISNHFLKSWREIVLSKKYFTENDWYEYAEIDKQGNISAHEADNIISKLNLKPYESDKKTMIIWLPERMNDRSANRLLKLIEEPPENTVFLLVTESPNRILPTIYSRVQRIRLSPICDEDLAAALAREGYDEKDVFSASRLGKGDYISAKQVLAISGSEKEHFNNFVLLMRLSYTYDMLKLLDWAENTASMSKERQKSFLVFAERLLRENFVLNVNPEIAYLGFEELEWAKKFCRNINETNIFGLYRLINDCIPQIAQNGNSKIIFTDFVIKIREFIRQKK